LDEVVSGAQTYAGVNGGGRLNVLGEELLGHFLVIGSVALVALIGEGLGQLDLWCSRTFGRSLSGRMNVLEIQTLFHGNTKDLDQI
jgi:hypothetical protein